jgi:hypothetical protein
MSSHSVTLDTVFGQLELRRKHSSAEQNKIPLPVCAGHIERALQSTLAFGAAGSVWRLARKEGFVALSPSVDAVELVAGLMHALRCGWLVAVAPGGDRDKDNKSAEVWAAYDVLQSRFGKEFHVSMRKHRIVGQEMVATVRQAEDYDVVPASEAAALIVRMATSAGAGRWQAAAALLAKHIVDLRSPTNSTGFMLLRAPMSYAERITPPEDVITPAKLKKLAAKNWLEVLVYGRDGKSLPNVKLEITMPNGEVETKVTPSNGKIRIDGIFESGGGEIAILEVGKLVVRKK